MVARKAALSVLMTLLLVPVVFAGCGGGGGGHPAAVDKTDQGVFPKIREIIYPTMGYPQIVAAGEEFTLEFDFTVDDPAAARPGKVDNWRARVTSSNGYVAYEADLEVVGTKEARSERWPAGSGREVYDAYLVTARVPGDVPPDLYDLEVRVEADGKEVVDSQPNSVSVTEGPKQEYRVVQVTDIHVFDIEYPGSCWRDRELRDAIYLRKAIEQINLIHPDFAVFTGDLIYGQKYMPEDWPPDEERSGMSEYEYEYLWAYEAMSELDVPCFYVMGNHDGYNDTVKDGYDWWTESFGPLFYSFDYGDHHYTMINSMDWSPEERALERGSFYTWVEVLQPGRWQGQVRGEGDIFGQEEAPAPETYTGQLAWIRDDLAAHRDAGLRAACIHHDPAQSKSYDDADEYGIRLGGRGEGRLALLRLCADYQVSLVMSGHVHEDVVTVLPWSGGGGATVYADTTCIEPKGGTSMEYPGYRVVEISGDAVSSYDYKDPKWSYPLYAGVVPGQENDLDSLEDPAVEIRFSNGGDWSAAAAEVTCTVANRLDKPLPGCRLEFFMPAAGGLALSGAEGAELEVVPAPGREGWVIAWVSLDLPAASETTVKLGPG